jgi:hypothetical protein
MDFPLFLQRREKMAPNDFFDILHFFYDLEKKFFARKKKLSA